MVVLTVNTQKQYSRSVKMRDAFPWSYIIVWFLSEMKTARHQETQLVAGLPSPLLASPNALSINIQIFPTAFRCHSKGGLLGRANAPEVFQQSSASLYRGSWVMVSAECAGGDCGVVLWSLLFVSLVPEMVVHCHSRSECIFALLGTKEWVSPII